MSSASFDTLHTDAFLELGVVAPGQHWSSFNVSREDARRGLAEKFVITIWNYHSTKDSSGKRTPSQIAICQDVGDKSLWYRVEKPTPGTKRLTWVAHWKGIELALETKIPIVGVLKDVLTRKCSLLNIFDISEGRFQLDGSAIWLRLEPRGEIGCPVRDISIDLLTTDTGEVFQHSSYDEDFNKRVAESSNLETSQRKARLSKAPRFAKKVRVTSWAFVRNSDVVAEVLHTAKGECGQCGQPAPFIRRAERTPYLEVHHRVPLSCGGEDTVENAIALCPNCHRKAHYG